MSEAEEQGSPDPIGLGVRSNTLPARRILAGTIDEALIVGTAALPADFDEAYWNCAPQQQQIPYLRGDERFALINLWSANTAGAFTDTRGNTVLHLTLPEQTTFLLLRLRDGAVMTLLLHRYRDHRARQRRHQVSLACSLAKSTGNRTAHR